MKGLPKLSESELKIMMVIWETEQPVYLADIREKVKEENWAESTVRNFLARIIEKGYLKIEKDGKKNIYKPIISENYLNVESKNMIKKYYDNSLKKFISELYRSDYIGYSEILELKKYLDENIIRREK